MLHRNFSIQMHHTQGIPVESFASKLNLFVDYFDLLIQHHELGLTQAVQHRVVAVDKIVQVTNIPKTKVETGQTKYYINQQTWFLTGEYLYLMNVCSCRAAF